MAKCNGCGCTDARACDGGCSWVYESPGFNICSRCDGGEKDMYATLARIEKLSRAFGVGDLSEIQSLATRAQKRHRDLVARDEAELRREQKLDRTRAKKDKR